MVLIHITRQTDRIVFVPPPPVNRPKIPPSKPTVKVRSSKPRPTRTITTTAVGVPNISVPPFSTGSGSGIVGSLGGKDLMPDLANVGFFGGTKSISVGNDFTGTFYSFRYDRDGNLLYEAGRSKWYELLLDFLKDDWNPLVLSRLYRSPEKLYATQFLVPAVMTSQGPEQFGIDTLEFDPIDWMVHYKGTIQSKTDGRFRFWGVGDFLIVRVNKEMVFMDYFQEERNDYIPTSVWPRFTESELEQNKNGREAWRMLTRDSIRGGVWIGKWFELKAGEPVEMEVVTGEGGGAYFTCALLIQQEGAEYSENAQGMPILPVFKTAEMSQSLKNRLEYKLIPAEMDLESELMFNVH
jgi:hypothetical protein